MPEKREDNLPNNVVRFEASINHSIYSADRTTHLKIIVMALVVSIGAASFGIATHFKADKQYSAAAPVLKADKPSIRFAVALAAGQDGLSDLPISMALRCCSAESNERFMEHSLYDQQVGTRL